MLHLEASSAYSLARILGAGLLGPNDYVDVRQQKEGDGTVLKLEIVHEDGDVTLIEDR